MTRKVLFLDIDGVLNSHSSTLQGITLTVRKNTVRVDRMLRDIDPRAVAHLKFIIEFVPGLEIVISSTWREIYTPEEFKECFEKLGLDPNIIVGFTPRGHGSRISQILTRVKNDNLSLDEIAIVDDYDVGERDESGSDWRRRFVQTDNYDGLSYRNTVELIDKFGKWEQPWVGI